LLLCLRSGEGGWTEVYWCHPTTAIRTSDIVISVYDLLPLHTRRVSRVIADDAWLRPTAGAVPGRVMINDYREIDRTYKTCCGAAWFVKKRPRQTQQQILYFSISGRRRRRSLTTRPKLTRPRWHIVIIKRTDIIILICVCIRNGGRLARVMLNGSKRKRQSDRRKIGFLVRRAVSSRGCIAVAIQPTTVRLRLCRI
jgi:hypothetical protein